MGLVTFSSVSFAETSSFTCYINVYQDFHSDFSSACFSWLPWLPPQLRREIFWRVCTLVSLLSNTEIRHFQLTVWKQPPHDQNSTQHLPPRQDMFLLLFVYLGEKGNSICWGIKSNISPPGEISWTPSYLLVSTCPDLTETSAGLSSKYLSSSPRFLYPHCAGQSFFRFSPPLSNANFEWFCFPLLCPTSPSYGLHWIKWKLPERQSDHVALGILHTLVLKLSSHPTVTGGFLVCPLHSAAWHWGHRWALFITVSPGPSTVLCANKCLLIKWMKLI